MKILLINNRHYRKGGAETVYFNTARLLREHGHEVIFFSSMEGNPEICDQQKYFIEAYENQSRLKAVRNYFYNPEAKRNLRQLLEAEKPDIAHVHIFWGGISPSIFSVLKQYHIPLVHTAHDYRTVCPAYTFRDGKGNICEACQGRYFYKCALKRCSKHAFAQSVLMTMEMYFRNCFFHPAKNVDGMIYVSQFSRLKHFQYGKQFAKIKSLVLYNTTPKVIVGRLKKEEKRYFLYYGRLSEEKGLLTLIEAFAGLPDIGLKIVGTGPLKNILESRVRDSGLKNIEFLGLKFGMELNCLIQSALFVIVPSEWYENNPMTIVEAYMNGVPVLGANIGGIPEIIENGKTGFIFPPADPVRLREVVKKAFEMLAGDYEVMCEHTLQFADKNFEEKKYYKILFDFYTIVIQNYEKNQAYI